MSRNNQTPQNPISFKTVPGRHRTQKWSKAPTYSYEGDDWGGYDPYDEYGGPDEEPPPPVPSQAPYPAQQGKPRGRQSFDRGDEARQFSAPAGPATPPFDPRERDQRQMSAGSSSATSVGRGSNEFPRSGSRPRDFTNPDAAPPPLMTKAAAPPAQWFPPRKSSLRGDTPESRAQAEEARAMAASLGNAPQTSTSPNTDKPLPFIRPSDIYKRIPDEIRRQSEEGSRPSTDSLQRELSPSQPALTPVEESRESRLLAGYEVPKLDTDVPKAAPERTLSPNSRSQLPSFAAARSRDASPATSQLSGLQTNFDSAQRGPSTNSSLPEQQFSSSGAAIMDTSSHLDSTGQDARTIAARAFNAPVLNSAAAAPESSIQNTPTTSRASAHDGPVGAEAESNSSGLQHQPSAGFRSAVHQAFDRPDDPSLSRDGSQGTNSGVSRSDTNSTAGISPIMSRVPSAATAQLRQQKVDGQVPPIAEESTITPTGSPPGSGLQGVQRIARKPSPGHSRNASGEEHAGFESGYRRSLDPPSNGTSPARTPGLETTANKRLSTPMSAVTMVEHDDPDVPDQAAEIPEPELEPAETSASEVSAIRDLEEPVTSKPLPSVGRGRSGTDYSTREADIADNVNSSPDKGVASPNIAQAQRDSQKLFLDTHGTPTSPPSPAIKDPNRSVTGVPIHGTRTGSPAKGRVREIADKYHEIHQNSRRNSAASVASSKSSWSQFGDAPKSKLQGTSQSQLRPEIEREESFNPDLPGAWISTAPTPGIESPPVQSALNMRSPRLATGDGEVDLTPTTKKYRLSEGPVAGESTFIPTDKARNSAFDAAKNAGDQLGASLLGNVGIGHQTRDFASTEPAAPVDQPEMQPKPARGALGPHPPLLRQGTDSTEAPSSVAASIPPTPPDEDTPKQDTLDVTGGGYFGTVAPLRVRSREGSPQRAGSLNQRPAVLPTLSTDAGASGFESDRLRREIARSLDSVKREELEHDDTLEDTERTQGALDAPENERRVEQGHPAAPAAEANPPRPGLLTTRFSWEDQGDGQVLPKVVEPVPEPASPEIKPEAAYERPRSRNLHVMNADNPDSPVEESTPVVREPPFATNTLTSSLSAGGASDTVKGVSPITNGQEHLPSETNVQPGSPSEPLKDLAPSPMSDHAEDPTTAAWRLPSYYSGEHEQELSHAPEKDHTNASAMSQPSTQSLRKSAGPIPPFRNILALRTSDERIKTYNDTRQTFADMNTGLNDWLSQMLAAHPEHAEALSSGVFKAPALQSQTPNFKRGHRPNPSLAKFTNRFGSGERQRSTSVGSTEDGPGPSASASAGGPRIDTEKMQQRGKDFMKSAGVFGGKAQAGAKGLFAKGKSRFGSTRGKTGGNEAPSSPLSPSSPSSTVFRMVPPAGTIRTSPREVVGPKSPLAIPVIPSAKKREAEKRLSEMNLAKSKEGKDMKVPPPTMVDSRNLLGQESAGDVDARPPLLATPSLGQTELFSQQTSSVAGMAPPAMDPPTHTVSKGPSPSPSPGHGHQTPTSNLSRQPSTSTSDASPFRPPRSQTPSARKTESKRPISQVFERLKDKGRSLSRSSTKSEKSGRSRSRPASLVLTNPDLFEAEAEAERGDAVGKLKDEGSFSVVGVRSTERRVESWEGPRSTNPTGEEAVSATSGRRVMSMASSQRTEAWNEPDAVIPQTPGTPRKENDERDAGRLGVLPSPAPTAATFDSGGRRASLEVGKRRSSNAPLGSVGSSDMVRHDLALAPVPSAEDVGEEMAERSALSEQAGNQQVQRPKAIRKSSDLGGLPSQQQQPQHMTITTAIAKDQGEQEQNAEDVSPSSPTASAGRRSAERERKYLPQHQRRVSDLALLPSQRRTLDSQQAPSPTTPQGSQTAQSPQSPVLPSPPKTSRRPDSQTLVPLTIPSSETVDGEIYEASPVTIKPMSLTLLTDRMANPPDIQAVAATVKEEDGLYDSTPTAARTQALKEEDELYDSTPVAERSKAPWKAATGTETGHEAEIAKMERAIQQAAAAASPPAAVGPQDASWLEVEETRSEISAEGGALEDSPKPVVTDSRQSSVSSLGAQDAAAIKDARVGFTGEQALRRVISADVPVMSSQAVPAGPVTSPQPTQQQQNTPFGVVNVPTQQAAPMQGGLGSEAYQQRFADRSYGGMQGSQMQDRPLSYMPLPRDHQGNLVDETISTGADAEQHVPPVDLSRIAGPPPGAPPFQQHPLFRSSPGATAVQPTEYERLRSSVASAVSPAHSRQPSGDVSEAAAKRTSGFFRGSRQPPEESNSSLPPNASRLGDQHGSGSDGARESGDLPTSLSPSRQGEEKQARRRSGIWEALTSRGSSSAAKMDSSRDSSVAALDSRQQSTPQGSAQDGSQPGTLRRPHRASTTAEELEPKKKRFSKLGSLFGRSNTTGQDKSKPKRLTKMNRTDSSRKPGTIEESKPSAFGTVTGSVRGYREYEAMRQHDMPALQENSAIERARSGNAPPQRPHPPSHGPNSPAPPDTQPPPGGWYAPENNRERETTAVTPTRGPPLPEFRSLHSSGPRPSRPTAQVSEAFRPIESSFDRNVKGIGPPPDDAAFRGFSSSNVPTQASFVPDRQPSYSGPPPAATPSERMGMMMDPSRPRNPSHGSDVSHLSRDISGRSEYWPSGSRPFGSIGSVGSISPVQSRAGSEEHPPPRHQRMGSIGREMGRSPVQKYGDQQTPWAVAMPPRVPEGDGPPSWSMGPPERRMSGQAQGMRSLPLGATYHPQQPYPYTSQSPGHVPPRARDTRIPWEDHQPVRQNTYPPTPPPPELTAYASPPYSPGSPPRIHDQRHPYAYPQQQQQRLPPPPRGPQYQHQYQYQYQQQRPAPQNRYYARQQQQPSSPPRYQAPPPQAQRSSSGYSGRRDDPTVGEEELVMRGASYPGQEWMPAGLGRGGWD